MSFSYNCRVCIVIVAFYLATSSTARHHHHHHHHEKTPAIPLDDVDVPRESPIVTRGILGTLFGWQKAVFAHIADGLNALWQTNDKDVHLLLFTQKNQHDPQELDHNCSNIKSSNFDASKHTKLIIHGFAPTGSPIKDFWGTRKNRSHLIIGELTIKNAYLNAGKDFNLIVVDWTAISGTVFYTKAASATHVVGQSVANFVAKMIEEKYITLDNLHIIGFSLGAQTAGIAGRFIFELTGSKAKRVTGLDPAGPGFDLFIERFQDVSTVPGDTRFMIDKTDGEFVDIIHCNKGFKKLGMIAEAGHADFYPNGGSDQPGCDEWLKRGTSEDRDCNHARCWELYSESIEIKKFMACPCPSWAEHLNRHCKCKPEEQIEMGDGCPPTANGSYYLDALTKKAYYPDVYDAEFLKIEQ